MPPRGLAHHQRTRSWVNVNYNTAWIEAPGVWTFYLVLLGVAWLMACGFADPTTALSYVVLLNFIVTFYYFHWHKGSPIATDQGQYDRLTFWEQMDSGVQFTVNKKFLTAVPVVIFLLSWKKGDHDTLLGSLNLICTVVLVIAKLPQMHKVRIFGINS